MLPSIVGPPLKGVADFKAPENPKAENSRDEKKAGSDSFGQMLGAKVAPKAKERDESGPIRERVPLKADKAERPERAAQEESRRPESEKKAEKLSAAKDNGAEKKIKGNGQRENAILNFMDSFESEFGVPPTRIVEAMANLKATDQAESPEATADQVIGQLDLDDQQEDQAKEMYMGLLAQLAQIDRTPQPPVPPPEPETQAERMFGGATAVGALVHERFSSAQEKRQVLNQSLDSMNQKFWMKGGNASLSDKLAQMSIQEKMLQSQGFQVDESLLTAQVQQPVADLPVLPQDRQALPGDSDESSSPEVALASLIAAARAAKGGGKDAKEMTSEFGDGAFAEAEAGAIRETAPEAGQAKASQRGEALNVAEGSSQNPSKGFEFGKNSQQQQEGFTQGQASGAKGEILEKAKRSEKADFKQSLGLEGLQASAAPLKQETLLGAAAVAGGAQAMPAPTPAEHEANIRQIMNQAQYLIKKGGGEMKVEMTPEGMGKINMKVLVQDGKVNVQMAAETQEAKKTLESSLSDLKNSLAAHKLSMDHVKIDVVSGPNTDNSAQNQTNQNNTGSRDQTRQFWNHFSENFGSPNQQRGGFTDIPSLRGYPRPRSDKGLEPVQTASVNKYAEAGKGKGLNLVA